jgi:hypothetical protein
LVLASGLSRTAARIAILMCGHGCKSDRVGGSDVVWLRDLYALTRTHALRARNIFTNLAGPGAVDRPCPGRVPCAGTFWCEDQAPLAGGGVFDLW